MQATFQGFRSILADFRPLLSQASAPSPSGVGLGEVGVPQEALVRESSPPAVVSSEEEDPLEGTSSGNSRYKLSLEEVDELLAAIYDTLDIREEQVQLSRHDLMYQGLQETKARVFPVHKVLSEAVRKEWADPERKPFFLEMFKEKVSF